MARQALNPEEKISAIVRDELLKLDSLFNDGEPDVLVIDVCRAVDFYAMKFFSREGHASEDEHLQYDYIKRGFPLLLRSFYLNAQLKPGFPLRPSIPEVDCLVDALLITSGKVSVAEQLVRQSEAQLVRLAEEANGVFKFGYPIQNSGVEAIENENIAAYFEKIKNSIAGAFRKHNKKQPEIHRQMTSLVHPDKGFLLKYDTTPEIDRFFSKRGHYRIITSQLSDVFDEKSLFGGIEYSKYIRVLKELVGIALKHTSYCACLVEKRSETNLRNIICIPRILNDIIPEYAEYLHLEEWEVKQIFSCLTVDADAVKHHIRHQKSFSPVFIMVSETHVMQSVYGSLNNPLLFLLSELKRRYQRDFDNNTDREERFRNEFYELIQENAAFKKKLLTIDREIVINVPGLKTDIDAVIFDRKTNNLALVQLKWQMLFAHDLKERRNRLSEFKKAEEWVRKMKIWSITRSSKDILSALTILEKLPDKNTQINKIFLFVINRYNASFTGFTPEDGAAWASWYLIDNIFEKLKGKLKDPIADLYRILTSPVLVERSAHDELNDFEMEVGGIRFVYKND